MKRCYAIGIGGTGSKCIEALLHGCASGLGPDRMTVGIVDQDRANGNVAGATRVLDIYRRLYRELRSGSTDLGSSSLFRTQIDALENPVWSPLPKRRIALEAHFNAAAMQRKARLLFDALFEEKGERKQPLDEGFRGRPAVGAAAMFSAATEETGIWTQLFDELRQSGNQTEVRVCIFASIFGGTGAAGFPTIARLIRETARRHGSQVTIGGILLLPYFVFPDGNDATQENLALSKNFLHTTKQALLYYNDLLTQSESGLFSHLYLIGVQRPFTLPNLGAGNNEQRNPALVPELLAAAAALQFLQNKPENSNKTCILRAGHRVPSSPNGTAIGWDDIPRVALDLKAHDVRDNLARLVRFATAYLAVYRPHLGRTTPRSIASQTWFHRLIVSAKVNLMLEATQQTVTDLESYCTALMGWLHELSERRAPSDLAIDLFRFDDAATDQRTAPHGTYRLNGAAAAFDEIVPLEKTRKLADVFYSLSTERAEKDRRGLGIFIDKLYSGCGL
jgi:hypothetical protein